MGTRSITHIHEMEELGEQIVCSFFRHWDGYPEGHGNDLVRWLKDKKLTNGIMVGEDNTNKYNRAGTMAVPLMMYIQEESGCEVIPTGDSNHGEEFVYHIYFRANEFVVSCESVYGDGRVMATAAELAENGWWTESDEDTDPYS